MRKAQAIVTALIAMLGFTTACYGADARLGGASLCVLMLTVGYEVMCEAEIRDRHASDARHAANLARRAKYGF